MPASFLFYTYTALTIADIITFHLSTVNLVIKSSPSKHTDHFAMCLKTVIKRRRFVVTDKMG